MASRSTWGAYVAFSTTEYLYAQLPVDTAAVSEAIVNNLIHATSMVNQTVVNYVCGASDTAASPTAESETSYQLVRPRWGSFPMPVSVDGTFMPMVVEIATKANGAATVDWIVRILAVPVTGIVRETSNPVTGWAHITHVQSAAATVAWRAMDEDTIVAQDRELAIGTYLHSHRQPATNSADPDVYRLYRGILEVWCKTDDDQQTSELHGVHARFYDV